MGLRASAFNHVLRLDDRAALFNAWSETYLNAPPSIAQALDSGEIQQLSPLWLGRLIQQGFLVPEQLNEWEQALERLRERRAGAVMQVIAVPTWRCNLRCDYCYEAAAEVNRENRAETWADTLSSLIENHLLAQPQDSLCLAFFGGEPLIQAAACAQLAERARLTATAKGIPCLCTLTTNGTILNRAVLSLLDQIDAAQITLDGTGEANDRMRFGEKGRPTYRRIMAFAAEVRRRRPRLIIRYHLRDDSPGVLRHSAERLLLDLDGCQETTLYFATVSCASYREAFQSCSHAAATDDGLQEQLQRARDAFLAAGWSAEAVQLHEKGTSPLLPVGAGCGYLNRRTILVEPDLSVGFCPVAVRNPAMRAGHLTSRGRLELRPDFARLLEADRFPEQCRECRVFPLCEGGCPAKSVVNHECFDTIYCERQRLETGIRRNLQQLCSTL